MANIPANYVAGNFEKNVETYNFCVMIECGETIVLRYLHIRSASVHNRAYAFYTTLAASLLFAGCLARLPYVS